MFNKKVLGALAKVVALLLLAQAALVIITSAMAYSGAPANLDPSLMQAIAIIQQLGSIAFLYVVLGAAYRLATKCRKNCQICPNCGKCMEDCMCADSSSSAASKKSSSSTKKTAAKKKSSTKKSTTKKKSSSRSKKK